MIRTLVLLFLAFNSNIYCGKTREVNVKQYGAQLGNVAKRGKKRNQRRSPSLEQYAREKFPGPDVQLGQKMVHTSSERRVRNAAWQEAVLLVYTTNAGSPEQIAAVKTLLLAHVRPDMKNMNKCGISFQGSPLCNAARAGNKDLVEILLQAHAPVDTLSLFSSKRGYGEEMAIHGAARARKEKTAFEGFYPEVIELLHAHGANMNCGGETQKLPFAPIHMVVLQRVNHKEAVENHVARQIAVLRALINCGADLEKTTFNGDTACSLARKRGNTEVADFLEAALLNKREFVQHFVAFQADKSPENKRRAAEALLNNKPNGAPAKSKARNQSKHRRARRSSKAERYEYAAASSSSCGDDSPVVFRKNVK